MRDGFHQKYKMYKNGDFVSYKIYTDKRRWLHELYFLVLDILNAN